MKGKSKKITAIVLSVLMLGWWAYSACSVLLGAASLYITAHGWTHDIPVVNNLNENVKVAITTPGYYLTPEEDGYNQRAGNEGREMIPGIIRDRIVDSQISFLVLELINIDTVAFNLDSGSEVSIFVPTENDWVPHGELNLVAVFDDGFVGYKTVRVEYVDGGAYLEDQLIGDFVIDSREDLIPIEDSMRNVADEIRNDAVPVWVGYLGQFYFLFQILSLVVVPFLIGWVLLWGLRNKLS